MTHGSDRSVAAVVRGMIRERATAAWQQGDVPDHLPLGPAGLGLDSIGIVELLLECEARLGVPFPAAMFDDGPLTVVRLIEHAERSFPRWAP